MKKLQILTLVFLLTIPVFGQDTLRTKPTEQYVYAEIVGVIRFINSKLIVSVDFGQNSELFENIYLRDSLGKAITFSSMVDALNKMQYMGWEYVQAYVAPEPGKNEYHWLLKLNLSHLSAGQLEQVTCKLKTKKTKTQ